jgi:ATP-dependent Clp protease ATP-binding subunit ClpC
MAAAEAGGVDRLSDDATKATMAAMDLGNRIGVAELRNELLLAGVVAYPERARQTLQDFGIFDTEAERAAVQVLRDAKMTTTTTTATTSKEPLPFGADAKATLSQACQIANDMEDPTVRAEHLLLALMGYTNGQTISNIPVGNVLKAMPAIKKKGKFSVTDFCNQLVQALPLTPGTSRNRVLMNRGDTGANGSTLQEVGVDWTQLALDGKLDPVFGRDAEIRSALRTLGRRRKNNPVLLGDPGVGKSAVAEGVATVLAQGLLTLQAAQEGQAPLSRMGNMMSNAFGGGSKTKDDDDGADGTVPVMPPLPPCPATLIGTRLISIELASLVADTASRGSFEEKLKNLVKEATESNVILFIDELHNLVGAGGGGEGALNAANLLKPALARGELRVLGATTTPEYRRYIEADGALERRFQPLNVKEPTVYETLDILAALSPKYEDFHGVKYTYEALVAAAKLSDRYLTDRFLPDKAVDLMDEAGSKVKMREEDDSDTFNVTEDDIASVISELTGIPLGKLDRGEKARLKNLETALAERVKGQPLAIRSVAKSIRRARSGMRDGKRPVASFLFCGSTGVGKTELCKALAEIYYGKEKDMIRIDMSEYMDRFSTSRLIGAPPGYVGYQQGGQLTEAVRRAPHSVILFDEVGLLNGFLFVLWE